MIHKRDRDNKIVFELSVEFIVLLIHLICAFNFTTTTTKFSQINDIFCIWNLCMINLSTTTTTKKKKNIKNWYIYDKLSSLFVNINGCENLIK